MVKCGNSNNKGPAINIKVSKILQQVKLFKKYSSKLKCRSKFRKILVPVLEEKFTYASQICSMVTFILKEKFQFFVFHAKFRRRFVIHLFNSLSDSSDGGNDGRWLTSLSLAELKLAYKPEVPRHSKTLAAFFLIRQGLFLHQL